MDPQSLSYLAGTATLVAGGAAAVYRWVRPKVAPIWSGILSLGEIAAGLKRVEYELQPNSGSSFRDEFRRVAQNVRLIGECQRAYQDNRDAACFEADASGKNTWASSTYGRLVQRSPADLLGYGWINVIALDYRDSVREQWDEAVSEGREFRARYVMVSYDTTRFTVECVARPVTDPADGKIHRWVGSIRKLTTPAPRADEE